MAIKKQLKTIGIIVLSFLILVIILFILNFSTSKCDLPAHVKVFAYFNQTKDIIHLVPEEQRLNITSNLIEEEKFCFYQSSTFCRENEIKYEGSCLYKPKGFFETTLGIVILIFIGLLGLGIFIYYIYTKIKPPYEPKEQIIAWDNNTMDCAKKVIEEKLCKQFHISHWYDKGILNFRDDAIKWTEKQQDYSKHQNQMIRAQVELLEGDNPGTYTFDLNLSKGLQHIRDSIYFFEHTFFDNVYTKPHEMPRAEPKDPLQRRLEKLEEVHPELARKVEEKAIEKELEKESTPEFTQEERVGTTQVTEQLPYYRRRQLRQKRRR